MIEWSLEQKLFGLISMTKKVENSDSDECVDAFVAVCLILVCVCVVVYALSNMAY